MAQEINWDLGSGVLTYNLSNLVRLTYNFTQTSYRPETNRPKKNALPIGCLNNSWQIFYPHCSVIAPSYLLSPMGEV